MRIFLLAAGLALLSLASAAEKSARQLAQEAALAEHNGDVVRAYLLYSEAAAKDPSNKMLWLRAETLRPIATARAAKTATPEAPAAKMALGLGKISQAEIAESRHLLPPPELKGAPGIKDFDLRGDSRELFGKIAKAFNLEAAFDPAYQPKNDLVLRLTEADYHSALRTLEAASGSFVVPFDSRRFLVANDTTQKRTEFDPTLSVIIPIPEPFSVQEAQELATGVRGALDLQHLAVDSASRLILVRDRVSKVRMAQKLIQDLMTPRTQVAIEVDLLDISDTSSVTYGLSLPSAFALVWLGEPTSTRLTTTIPSGYTSFLGFGGGKSFIGIGITSGSLFGTVTKSQSTNLLRSEIVVADGQAGSLHVGDKYPIATNAYIGATNTGGTVYTPPPSFNFEDLGLLLKVTPHVHGLEDVTIDVESEFKLLGSSSVDGIPIISNRKFESKVRLISGEWAVLAGLMTSSEGRTISGIAGFTAIPFLRSNTHNVSHGQTLIVLKPHILNMPARESVTRAAWVGTETRPRSAL